MPSFNFTNFFFIGNLNCDWALHIKMISFLLSTVFKVMQHDSCQNANAELQNDLQMTLKTDLSQFVTFLESENGLQNYIF